MVMLFFQTRCSPLRRKMKLNLAYQRTTYWVHLSRQHIPVRIGRCNHRLDRFMNSSGYKKFAIISATNPASEPIKKSKNIFLNQLLKYKIIRKGLRFHPTLACADARNWPNEAGWIIFDNELSEIMTLGDQFGQLAIVTGETGKITTLVWLQSKSNLRVKPDTVMQKRRSRIRKSLMH